jgi:hypothetical protein
MIQIKQQICEQRNTFPAAQLYMRKQVGLLSLIS